MVDQRHQQIFRMTTRRLLIASLLFGSACRAPPPPADLVFRGGSIHTMDPAHPLLAAVAVRDGRIVALDGEVAALIGPQTAVVELGSRMLLPAFEDAHVHPVKGGHHLAECALDGFDTQAAVARAVARCAAAAPEAEWLTGRGWELTAFPGANPNRRLLDSLVFDRPVYLIAMDGHSAWVNSAALVRAGLTPETADPPGGRVERDPDGRPSGTLREAAMALVGRLVPTATLEAHVAAVRRALHEANRLGITSLYDARADSLMVEAYAAVARREGLTARVLAAVEIPPGPITGWAARIARWRDHTRSSRFEVIAGKLFLDGVIESGTAALLKPYLGGDGRRGTLNFTADSVAAVIVALDSAGLALHAHTIGDRAVRVALDGLERARPMAPATLAHLQLVHPADVARMARLGVIAAVQPLWAYRDRYIIELTEPVLGVERSGRIYPFGSLARAGVTLAGGSDWPVTSLEPLRAIQVAVTRRGPGAGPGPAWLPDERLTLYQALRAYTLGAATAMRREGETGSLTVGKLADLVVLERDLFEVPAESLATVSVVATYLEGRQVHTSGR